MVSPAPQSSGTLLLWSPIVRFKGSRWMGFFRRGGRAPAFTVRGSLLIHGNVCVDRLLLLGSFFMAMAMAAALATEDEAIMEA